MTAVVVDFVKMKQVLTRREPLTLEEWERIDSDPSIPKELRQQVFERFVGDIKAAAEDRKIAEDQQRRAVNATLPIEDLKECSEDYKKPATERQDALSEILNRADSLVKKRDIESLIDGANLCIWASCAAEDNEKYEDGISVEGHPDVLGFQDIDESAGKIFERIIVDLASRKNAGAGDAARELLNKESDPYVHRGSSHMLVIASTLMLDADIEPVLETQRGLRVVRKTAAKNKPQSSPL